MALIINCILIDSHFLFHLKWHLVVLRAISWRRFYSLHLRCIVTLDHDWIPELISLISRIDQIMFIAIIAAVLKFLYLHFWLITVFKLLDLLFFQFKFSTLSRFYIRTWAVTEWLNLCTSLFIEYCFAFLGQSLVLVWLFRCFLIHL